jgi:hypothetical protein
MAKKGKITGGHTVTDSMGSKIKKGSQVLYLPKSAMSPPCYFNCHHYVVVDVLQEDVSHLEPKNSIYYGDTIVKISVKLWDGNDITTIKNYDKLLDLTKQIPKSRHKKIPKKLSSR